MEAFREILEKVKNGAIGVDEGVSLLKGQFYLDVGCAKVDLQRESRVGYPEVIYCSGKTAGQVKAILKAMLERDGNILATRVSPELFEDIREICPDALYSPLAGVFAIKRKKGEVPSSYIAVVTAGTSDLPVAEEAALTAELFGNRVERIVDVGVAGVHRLFANLEAIREARVVIVVAGMEGALPSLVGGLVDKPVIAVPTSVGYGASFHGLSALLAMLNSCSSGVCVVNIDNGYGAGYLASMINQL
ncbi:MAG: N5-carboxyaminoimidazole ribonucleotide mutase [Syntrophus sp. PtaU1.Bin208]|nr:MAG: N5-carboxyaminoimidazole ribonucleotide mutase [Syntrophus sp. PtaU1.Bin208]